ncbi:Sensitivity To Red Light Reduced-like SRR1 [Penicillium bovifimosum]|uniref:Sensitivity To Red Light Reduced-like SRR1 n=1 Tax=Penicillium bovifimosum TaxID=126998 RepID=A0A9W9LBN0_9EURO|nr:Sensitivity To Red Light Reduced-like SRR1 [Penicillium bovifimosum]KAJ5146110.1 Sensitivity To Red Light Reduced-like SRR1 [Penicillium bovifimosum]
MPHTSRTKRPTIQKRTQVTDDDGWTHVASSGSVRRVMRSRPRGTAAIIKDSEISSDYSSSNQSEPVLVPAEAPGRLTLPELQTQFETHRRRWESSESWSRLAGVLDERLKCRKLEQQASSSSSEAVCPIDAIICIGLGSPSGFLRDGWVDRRAVSLYQLAALASIKDRVASTTNQTIKVYAQDPVFNALDESLLAALNMDVLQHPAAFTHITSSTMLFCPGAERKHLELLLPSKPWLLFGGPLEHADAGGVLLEYVDCAGSFCLPVFEALEHAFWRMRLYWIESER